MNPVRALIRISLDVNPRLAARVEYLRRRRQRDPATRIMSRLVTRGDVVVDLGANWGSYTWNLLRLVGPSGHVHAIEPNPAMVRSLRAIGGGRPSLTLHAVAVSDRPGEAELNIPVVAGSTITELASLAVAPDRTAVPHERRTVRLATLDSLLPPESRVTFIKCDVEGHEAAVLRGASATLTRWHPALFVEIEQRHQAAGADIGDTFAQLLALDYVGYSVHPGGLRPLEEFDLRRDQLDHLEREFMPYAMPPGYVHDFLFVPPEWTRADGAGRLAGLMADRFEPARRGRQQA